VAISISLTPEQRQQIQAAGGAVCNEAVFVAPAKGGGKLDRELTGKEDQELANVLWQSNQKLIESSRGQSAVMEGYNHPPALVFLR